MPLDTYFIIMLSYAFLCALFLLNGPALQINHQLKILYTLTSVHLKV